MSRTSIDRPFYICYRNFKPQLERTRDFAEKGAFFGYYYVSDTRQVSFGHLDYERAESARSSISLTTTLSQATATSSPTISPLPIRNSTNWFYFL